MRSDVPPVVADRLTEPRTWRMVPRRNCNALVFIGEIMRFHTILSVLAMAIMTCGCKPPHDANTASEASNEPQVVETERVTAEAGVGKEGQKLKGKEGVLITPVKALFSTKQRVVFEIQIPQAMNLYKAEKGYPPKTEEEFMSRIIEFNKINLPELPEGHRYVYDPEKGELMVERPK